MPPIKEIEHIRLQFPEIVSLDNGIPLYILRGKAIQSVKLDFLFTAGQWFQTDKFISSFTNQMMREGTVTFTSSEIAEKLDYYGVFSETVLQRYQSGYSFYILNKHLDNILPLIAEMFMLPLFPENELEIYKKNIHQRLLVNQNKTQSLAAKKFNTVLFGKNHPLGFEIEPDDTLNVDNTTLKIFSEERITSENCRIIVSGNVTQETISSINSNFGIRKWNKKYKQTELNTDFLPDTQKIHKISKPETLQSALKIGTILKPDHFEDIFGLRVLNTLFGGYFGSRLMTNLREDKGYTYGIYSMLNLLVNQDIIFTIATETGNNVCQNALKEIYKELTQLLESPASEEELELVKRHMLGDMLSLFDGPFASANALKGLFEAGLDYNFLEDSIKYIKQTDPNAIHQIAQKFFKNTELHEVIAGNCNQQLK
jgi:predicted Zn-dependent peptidase